MDLQAAFQNWLASFVDFLPKLIAGIVIFILTLVASGFVAKWVRRLVKKRIEDAEILQLVFVITRWSIIIMGTILALSQVNFDVTGFIAGLGVAGFTIGFALQDIAKNFISGLLLLYRQPFSLGEYVEVADYSGTVKEINIRDTVIETLSGELVIIPNQDVFESPILNYTRTRYRRDSVMIGLGYDEDVNRAYEVFMGAIKAVEGVEEEPAPNIRAKELGDSTLILEAQFWTDQQNRNLLDVRSNVIKAIKEASEEHHINLPYPVQTVLLKNTD